MMNQKINVAIQVLPRSAKVGTYELVDRAIEVIQQSGLKYRVCPFETVIEGTYDQIMTVVKEAQQAVYAHGGEEMITYLKIQTRHNEDVLIEDKMNKYE